MKSPENQDSNHGRELLIRRFISNCMWMWWGFFFLPLKLFGAVKCIHNQKNTSLLHRPVIIASNHRNIFDPLFIGVAIFPFITLRILPLTVYAAPLNRLANHPIQKISKRIGFFQSAYFLFNVVRIPEQGTLFEKIQPLANAIHHRESVLIFPEGRCLSEGNTRPFKQGVAELHKQSQAPIIPCAVHYYKKRFFWRVVICFGEAISIPHSTYKNTGLDGAAEEIRRSVEEQYQKCIKYSTIQ